MLAFLFLPVLSMCVLFTDAGADDIPGLISKYFKDEIKVSFEDPKPLKKDPEVLDGVYINHYELHLKSPMRDRWVKSHTTSREVYHGTKPNTAIKSIVEQGYNEGVINVGSIPQIPANAPTSGVCATDSMTKASNYAREFPIKSSDGKSEHIFKAILKNKMDASYQTCQWDEGKRRIFVLSRSGIVADSIIVFHIFTVKANHIMVKFMKFLGNSELFYIELDKESKILDVKKKITQEKGEKEFPAEKLELSIDGKTLEDEKILKDCKIDEFTLIFIDIHRETKSTGTSESAGKLGNMTFMRSAPLDLYIVPTFIDYKIPTLTKAAGSITKSAPRTPPNPLAKKTIQFRTLKQDKFQLTFNVGDKVSDIKQRIQNEKDFQVAKQTLIFSGKILSDEKTVYDLDIKDNDFIVVMVQ